ASILLLLGAWFWSESPAVWACIVLAYAFIPALTPLADQLERRLRGQTYGWQRVPEEMLRTIVSVSLLPHRAWISTDAIIRVLYRRASGRLLLEWQTAETAAHSAERHTRNTIRQASIIAVASAILLAVLFHRPLWMTFPFLALWTTAPITILWLGTKITQARGKSIDAPSRGFLRHMARLTWRYFDDLVGPKTNWLPPDNSQTALRVEVAQRTSPTNIGLWLTSSLAAVDFGYITPDDFLRRTRATIDSLSRMERYEGHWLNWYDIGNLAPLNPRYVSTVDSGNLLACLWVFEQGLRGIANAPLPGPACIRGLRDTVDALAQASGRDPLAKALTQSMKRIFHGATKTDAVRRLRLAQQPVGQLMKSLRWKVSEDDERSYWVSQLDRQVNGWLGCVDRYLPWLETLAAPPGEFLMALDPTAPGLRDRALRIVPSLKALSTGEHDVLDQILEFGNKAASHPDQAAWIAQIRSEFEASQRAATETVRQIESLADTVHRLAAGVNMSFLYDSHRDLFGIGYALDAPIEFQNHYDLLASECRLGSLTAIAKGDAPVKHWMALGRPYLTAPEGQLVLSWSGTMFEYLMPMLFTKSFENSLLDTACNIAVERQIEYGREKGRPWGVSECAYRALDSNRIYQYRAFGIPDLALRQSVDDELVVSPYSSFLALMVAPRAAIANLERLKEFGLVGPMGYYEAIDFTSSDSEKPGRGTIIYCYMAHHQGMSLLSLDNLLNKEAMQKRYHANLRVKAVESLLFERVPPVPSLLREGESSLADLHAAEELEPQNQSWQEDSAVPRAHLLGNGRYSVAVTNAGSGFSRWNDFDITRWRPDTTLDGRGYYFYLRDLKSGVVWSATHQPAGGAAGLFTARFAVDRAEFVRKAYGIETITSVFVAPEDDVEIRRVRFHNQTPRVRELEVTSYMEIALATHGADLAHPAFSKLFVETEYSEGLQALLARRRLRSPEDPTVWIGHTLISPVSSSAIQHETSREQFIGRGRGLDSPRALTADLTGATGTVLDPIFSLRSRFSLGPREIAEAIYVTVAAATREQVESLLEKHRRLESIARTLELCWTHAQLELRYLGVSPAAIHQYQDLASHMIYPNARMRPAPERLAQNVIGQAG
ncbi:MAG: glucoamylase family protein, partial [Bryobacteraceae bacterium]